MIDSSPRQILFHAEELLRAIRDEMERHRQASDPQSVRFLISEGLQRLKELKSMLGVSS